MATRSYIGVRNENEIIDYIYCHWDGYVDYNGKILIQHYTDMNKIKALMELGDLSSLGKEIGEKHNFDAAKDSTFRGFREWCLAYGRDRGEKNEGIRTGDFRKLTSDRAVDYVYIFNGNSWECFDTYSGESLKLYE